MPLSESEERPPAYNHRNSSVNSIPLPFGNPDRNYAPTIPLYNDGPNSIPMLEYRPIPVPSPDRFPLVNIVPTPPNIGRPQSFAPRNLASQFELEEIPSTNPSAPTVVMATPMPNNEVRGQNTVCHVQLTI